MLYLVGLGLGLAVGFVPGGSLRRLGANVRLGWLWLLYAALGAQMWLALGPGDVPAGDERLAILLASYGLLVLWLGIAASGHRSWLRLAFAAVAAGSALNLAAIAPNRGIPVSLEALRIARLPSPAGQPNRFAVKHVVAGPDTIFNLIGDVIPIRPMRDVISIGDVLIMLGIAGVLAAGMRMRPVEAPGAALAAAAGPEPAPASPSSRNVVLHRSTTVEQFLERFAPPPAAGQAYDPMSETARHPSESRVVLSQAMSLTDANLAGNVHGGVVMKLVDTAAGLAAIKHAHSRVVTVSMDEMSFIEPVFLTDVVTLTAQVNDVGRTSMEVGVRVEAENSVTGERRHVSSAYLVFVALDAEGKPSPVPRLEAETDEERRRMEDAKIRRRHRIARKEALMERRRAESGVPGSEPAAVDDSSIEAPPAAPPPF
ncbi:MAG: hotdog domain-containing protein [Actinomycetota bacterium]